MHKTIGKAGLIFQDIYGEAGPELKAKIYAMDDNQLRAFISDYNEWNKKLYNGIMMDWNMVAGIVINESDLGEVEDESSIYSGTV